MAFTGILGRIDSNLGNLTIGRAAAAPVGPDLEPSVLSILGLTQTVGLNKSIRLSASNTLTFTQQGTLPKAKTAIVGFTGCQTRYVFMKDLTEGQELYKLNADTVMPYPASVTKIMTSLLLVEYKNAVLDSGSVTFTGADCSLPAGVSNGGFASGDVCTWRELLIAILVQSAGDACQCAARIIGTELYVAAGNTGNTGMVRFIERMNARAVELGMLNTVYWDAWGYSQSGGVTRNTITARDLATVCGTAFVLTPIRSASQIATYNLNVTGSNPRTLAFSQANRFIHGPTQNQSGIADPNCLGGKVGEWTAEGTHLNLAQMYTAPNGNEIVIVTMNSESYQAMTWDQQGLIYGMFKDWPYLLVGTSPPADANFADVRLLMGADGGIVDESSYGRTLTSVSGTLADSVIAESTGSVEFNAYTDTIEANDAVDLTVGSNDATIEVWYAAPSGGITNNDEKLFFSKLDAGGGNNEIAMNCYSNAFQVFASPTGSGWTSNVFCSVSAEERQVFFNGAPRHIAWVKNGSTIAGYLNGERFTNIISVGTLYDGIGKMRLGYSGISALGRFDDWRVTIGVARYTANKVYLPARAFGRSIVPTEGASNSFAISQLVSVAKVLNFDIHHTLTYAQVAHRVYTLTASNTLGLSQDNHFEKAKNVFGSNALALTHSVSVAKVINRTINHTLGMASGLGRNISKVEILPQVFPVTHHVIATRTKFATNTMIFSQSLDYFVSKGAKNSIEYTQTVARQLTANRMLNSLFGVTHQVTTGPNTFRRSLTSNLALTQSVVAYAVRGIDHTITFSQNVVVNKVKGASDYFNLAQVASTNVNYGRDAADFLFLDHAVDVKKVKNVSARSIFAPIQQVGKQRIRYASASSVFMPSHELVKSRYARSVLSSLAFSHAVSRVREIPRPESQAVAFTQTVRMNKVLNLSCSNTLVFKSSFDKHIGLGGMANFPLPAAQVVVVKNLVVLKGNNLAITLPAPEFNDGDAYTGSINIVRMKTGAKKVYKSDTERRVLDYTFIIERWKYLELKNFISQHPASPFIMENWKGERWYVMFNSNPFSFTEEARWESNPLTGPNKFVVLLSFQGVRLN